MASSSKSALTSNRRRNRRRRQDKPAIAAKLVLDDHIKSDVGIVSEDIFRDLFPHLGNAQLYQGATEDIHHIAIAPWIPNANPTDSPWSIVPIIESSALAPSTIRFSPSSASLQSFAVTLQQIAPSKLSSHSRGGIEILVLDVAPVPLETVFVSLESELTKRLENGEGTFFRDHPASSKAKGADSTPDGRLVTSLRAALSSLKVVHAGDLFPLPLPPHPLTHVPPNPGKIMLCEPVAQGVLTESTKIILMRGRVHTKQIRRVASMTASQQLNGVPEDEDDTSNDQFYSAAEDRDKSGMTTEDMESATETEPDMSDFDNEDELSDDSMDDMISLQAPTLPTTNASGVSTLQPGTPMTVGTLRGRKTNGIATPGSVFSNFTATTARPDRPRGRLFKAQGLMEQIPTDLLHPKPSLEDDEEARIYVDVTSLSRIGCFSGDWVRIEAAEEPPANGFGAFGLGSFGQVESEPAKWRPVRVYGLPEGYSQRPMTRIPSAKHGERRLSFFESQIQRPASPTAYASPILLANLDDAPYLRLAPLKKASYQGKGTIPRFTSAARPPYARDITIHHIRTPISAERAFQTAVLGGLKRYFAQKIRLVRSGDLIAVPVDAELGRTLQEMPGAGGSEVDDVMALTAGGQEGGKQPSKFDSVAWFKVGHIQIQKADEDEDGSAEAFWGSVACIDSSSVAMHGSGFETSRIPGIKQSTWQYYLGLKKTPKKASESTPAPIQEPELPYVSPLRRQLRELIAAATSARAIHLKMPPVAILLTSTHRNIGKLTLASGACSDMGLHTYKIDAYDILSEGSGSGNDVKTEGFLRTRAERAMSCGPDCCALLVQHVEALTADRIESTIKEILEDTRVLIATTNEVDKVPDGVRALFTHELEMTAPDEAERESILKSIISDRGVSLEPSIDLNSIALKTAALVAGDLVDVVERASIAQQSRLEQLSAKNTHDNTIITVRDVQVAGGPLARCLTKGDFEIAVEAARKNFSDSIGAPKIPNVTWDDVGGLNNVKEAVTETIQLPLERPELFAKGMKKRSGILFYGPPGTGKTLLAKAIATEYSLNFFSVKGPELLNMYIGESEANVRRVFQRARDARPCVVFFDELDSVAPKRGNQGDSGGVMDRIVSQLLAELDGMSGGDDGGGGVFVIGATNRPDLLDPALLRPGRFDKMLYLGVSDTNDKQQTILEALTRKFTLHPSVSLASVAEKLPFTYTGADFYALCSDAMLKAVTRQATAVDNKIRAINSDPVTQHPISTAYYFDHYATPEDIAVMVQEEDFLAANDELVPSVSAGELAHYEHVRATFEGVREKEPENKPPVQRVVSGASTSSKGKGKAVASGSSKGKGKAIALTSGDEFDEEDEVDDINGRSKGKVGPASNVVIRPVDLGFKVKSPKDNTVLIRVPFQKSGARFSVEFRDDLVTYRSNGTDYVNDGGVIVSEEPKNGLIIFASPPLPKVLVPSKTSSNVQVIHSGKVTQDTFGSKPTMIFEPGIHWIEKDGIVGKDHIKLHPNTHYVYFEPGAYVKAALEYTTKHTTFHTVGYGVLSGENYVYMANTVKNYTSVKDDRYSLRMFWHQSVMDNQTWHCIGPTLNSPPFNTMDLYPMNSTPHEEDNKVSAYIRDYKQVGAYYFQTDGTQMYRGSVRDVFWHVNDDAIKLYHSGAQLHALTIWKARNNAIIQVGWKPRNVSDVSVSKLRIIHNRWIKPDAYVPSAILGASPFYGDPKEIDTRRTMQVNIDDVVCEGICAALMTIAPMQNLDLKMSNVRFEMLHKDAELRLGRSVVGMDAGEGMDNYTPGQGNLTLGIHITNWTIGDKEVDKKNVGEDMLGQLKINPMFDGDWTIE